MSERSELERGLVRVLETLRDYRDDLILVGGWVPSLHLRYGRAAIHAPRTSLTAEADLLVPADHRRKGRRSIAEILRTAGFEPRGDAGVVWAREQVRDGETIEFLHPLKGPARSRGTAAPLDDQPDLRVLLLDHLRVMQAYTEVLMVPGSSEGEVIAIRVPTLGAFVLNKGNTFHLRGGPAGPLKAGKDLLYLRDIMAAGEDVVAAVEEDLVDIVAGGGPSAEALRRAAYHLRHVAPRYFEQAAAILAERDGLETVAARADVEGHLTDVADAVGGDR